MKKHFSKLLLSLQLILPGCLVVVRERPHHHPSHFYRWCDFCEAWHHHPRGCR